MPTLETTAGKPVEVTPPDADAVNAQFQASMNDDGPDEKAPPKREPRKPPEPRASKPRVTKSEKSRTTSKPAAAGLSDDQRSQGVQGLAQLGAALAMMAAKTTGSDAFLADAVVIASNADQLADACVQTAQADARFAAVLDKVCSAGPYAALVSVAVGVGTQIARNHRPSLLLPGTVDPAVLIESAKAP